jgi:hypothetical protein
LLTIVKIGEFAEFLETLVTEISTGKLRFPFFAIGLPKGCSNLETIEFLRLFQSCTELTEPETSKINRLLSVSGIGIPRARAGVPPKPNNPRANVTTEMIEVLLQLVID